MTDILTPTQPIYNCAVTQRGAGANQSVDVALGTVLSLGTLGVVSAGNVALTLADPLLDRIDAIVVSTSFAKSAIVGALADGKNARPPDIPSGYNALAYVYVFNQQHPSYTGTITNAMITDARAFTALPQPEESFAYTFLSGAQSAVDPGAGNYGFDTTSNGTLAHLYISAINANVPSGGGLGGISASMAEFFTQNLTIGAFYLRIWSRSDPTIWMLLKVTAFTDHTTWFDLSCASVAHSNHTVATVFPTASSLIPLDSIFEFAGFVSGPVPESGSGTLGADVSIPSANTFVDGPTVTPAGGASATYLLTGFVTVSGPAGADTATVRLTDGTTVFAEGENSIGASSFGTIYLSAIVPGNATYKFTVAHTSATAATIKRDPTVNSSGAHVGSKLMFVRIA